MDYGSIGPVSYPVFSKMQWSKQVLLSSQTFALVLIYISYLRDDQLFNFFLRCFVQLLIYNMPDIEGLTHPNAQSQALVVMYRSQILTYITVLGPYMLLNFLFSFVLHASWLYDSIAAFELVPLGTLVNSYTETLLLNSTWTHGSLFLDIIGESAMARESRPIASSLALVMSDIIIVWMQYTSIQIIYQQVLSLDPPPADGISPFGVPDTDQFPHNRLPGPGVPFTVNIFEWQR